MENNYYQKPIWLIEMEKQHSVKVWLEIAQMITEFHKKNRN